MGFTEDTTNQPDVASMGHPIGLPKPKNNLKFLLGRSTLIPTIAVYMTGEAVTQSGGNMMKTFLLLAVSSVVTAGVLPALPAKIILSAFVLIAVLTQAARRAPVGYQDENGFHLISARRHGTRGRALRRAGRKMLMSWLFSDSRRPAKA